MTVALPSEGKAHTLAQHGQPGAGAEPTANVWKPQQVSTLSWEAFGFGSGEAFPALLEQTHLPGARCAPPREHFRGMHPGSHPVIDRPATPSGVLWIRISGPCPKA